VGAKRSDHVPLRILTNDQRDRRCLENLSAPGALSGGDIPFVVSYFTQSALHRQDPFLKHSYNTLEQHRRLSNNVQCPPLSK
jgi:hypothetical protein